VNAGLDFVCELRRWAEARGVAVGVAFWDGEPCVHALGDHIGAWSRHDRRTGFGRGRDDRTRGY